MSRNSRRIGRSYNNRTPGETWRFRLLTFIGMALCFYVLATTENGGWAMIRRWQVVHAPSMAELHDYTVATQRWVVGLHLDTHARTLLADAQRRIDEAMPVVQQTLAYFRAE